MKNQSEFESVYKDAVEIVLNKVVDEDLKDRSLNLLIQIKRLVHDKILRVEDGIQLAKQLTVSVVLGQSNNQNSTILQFYKDCAGEFSSISFQTESEPYPGLPFFKGSNTLLRDFVNYLDETLDIEKVEKEFPDLTTFQIVEGMNFIKKLVEFNINGIDISNEEDRVVESDPTFQEYVKKSIIKD